MSVEHTCLPNRLNWPALASGLAQGGFLQNSLRTSSIAPHSCEIVRNHELHGHEVLLRHATPVPLPQPLMAEGGTYSLCATLAAEARP